MSTRGEIRIDRARLRGGVPADRERLVSALDSVSLSAIGLSPRAVLIVRRLAPRATFTRRGVAAPFVLGVQEDLRRRVAGARRGRQGRDDEDLLFEDEADFEAAVVADWVQGGGPSIGRWWSQIVEESSPVLRWRRSILSNPDLLARIVTRLAQRGAAIAWLATFEPGELFVATRGMLESRAATPAIAALAAPPPDLAPHGGRAGLADLAAIAPEAMGVARRDISVLMAVAIVLVRRPAWLGTKAFGRAVAMAAHPAPPTVGIRTEVPPASAPKAVDAARVAQRSIAAARTRPAPPPAPWRDGGTRASRSIAQPRPRAGKLALQPQPRRQVPPAVDPSRPPIIATEFGGLFFLLNVFLALGIYGDFTRPADGLKGLSPFELLLLLARHWFGAAFDADPLADLLRQLAGLQPGESPGRLFEAPVWSVPEAWLRPWLPRKGRRYGFVVADDPQTPRSAAWRRRRWVACLARYLRARLRRALGEVDGRAAANVTCRQPGRIAHERDRIEVHFPLADHPIALRLAGVDRDPGWIPAAGHFVEFRFL